MINNFYSNASEYIYATTGGSSQPFINMSAPSAGMVRYNGNTSTMEVYDGGYWQSLGNGTASIDVSSKMRSILSWAESKMHMEREIMAKIENNPTVADAYRAVKEAEEKLLVVMTLTNEDDVK